MQFTFLSIVLSGMFLLALFIGGVSMFEINRLVQSSTSELITEKCEKEASQINEIFAGMEKSVRIMESYILDLVNAGDDIKSPELQEEVVTQANKLFAEIAKNTDSTVAYYFRFSPEVSENMGLFYSRMKDTTGFVEFEPTDILRYPKEDREHVGWYWEPYEAGAAIWMTPYYNKNNDVTMISFVIPMYYQNSFFGVVGMDFDYSILTNKIDNIKIYENGYAHLEKDGEIVYFNATPAESPALERHPDDFHSVHELRNGMELVITADHNDMQKIKFEILLKFIIITVILTVFLSLIVIILVRRIVRPLKTLTKAAEKLAHNDYNIDFTPSNTKEIIQLNATVQHMIEQLQEHNKLQHILAYRDSLTGLRNTTAFNSWMNDFENKLHKNAFEFGVLVFDINFLKETNDYYGHETGNKLIVAAAKIIANTFKRSPVFRIGGDEFLVLIQNRDFRDHEELIKTLYNACEEEIITAGDRRIHVSIALGCAIYDPCTDNNFMDVFNRADSAMYEHKRKIKNSSNGNFTSKYIETADASK